ncbi:MAG: hypothetical protein HZB25_04835 [Candidatus Eisenbacteria bacterium]|nr:hypothetical protein [Candidatus Eisenbacteria bacterium]
MKRWGWLRILIGLALSQSVAPSAAAPVARPAHKLDSVTLGIRHRVFEDFRDLQKVRLKQKFIVGDTEYSASVVEYVPDFAMEMKSHKVISRSAEPRNPAFKIVVRLKGKPQDTTWAMLKMPPHFARNSMLAFKVARIDFIGREPIVNSDTTSDAAPAGGGTRKFPPSGGTVAPATGSATQPSTRGVGK